MQLYTAVVDAVVPCVVVIDAAMLYAAAMYVAVLCAAV